MLVTSSVAKYKNHTINLYDRLSLNIFFYFYYRILSSIRAIQVSSGRELHLHSVPMRRCSGLHRWLRWRLQTLHRRYDSILNILNIPKVQTNIPYKVLNRNRRHLAEIHNQQERLISFVSLPKKNLNGPIYRKQSSQLSNAIRSAPTCNITNSNSSRTTLSTHVSYRHRGILRRCWLRNARVSKQFLYCSQTKF